MRRWLDHISVVLALLGPLSSFAMTMPAMAQTEREQAALDGLFEQLRAPLTLQPPRA